MIYQLNDGTHEWAGVQVLLLKWPVSIYIIVIFSRSYSLHFKNKAIGYTMTHLNSPNKAAAGWCEGDGFLSAYRKKNKQSQRSQFSLQEALFLICVNKD